MGAPRRSDAPAGATCTEFECQLTLDGICATAREADAVLTAANAGESARYFCHLAIEEMLTNLMRHASPSAARLSLQIDGDEFSLLFTDDGEAFDPTQSPDPDLSLPVASRPVGGLGLYLLRKLASGASYVRREGWNLATFRHPLRDSKG